MKNQDTIVFRNIALLNGLSFLNRQTTIFQNQIETWYNDQGDGRVKTIPSPKEMTIGTR